MRASHEGLTSILLTLTEIYRWAERSKVRFMASRYLSLACRTFHPHSTVRGMFYVMSEQKNLHWQQRIRFHKGRLKNVTRRSWHPMMTSSNFRLFYQKQSFVSPTLYSFISFFCQRRPFLSCVVAKTKLSEIIGKVSISRLQKFFDVNQSQQLVGASIILLLVFASLLETEVLQHEMLKLKAETSWKHSTVLGIELLPMLDRLNHGSETAPL